MNYTVILRRFLICSIGIVAALITILSSSNSLAFTTEELDSMSSQTTVLIAESLHQTDLEQKREWYPGSGVIIAHSGSNYYAVTNTHVVREQMLGRLWGIRTADGEVHQITENPNNIIRFGTFIDDVNPIPGFDLALVKFISNRNYPVAVMGNSSKLQTNDQVFISGWPDPENLDKRRQRVFTNGKVAKIALSPDTNNGGYSLMYSNWTRAGMSGSPVFNSQGEVVGIHGRGRRNSKFYCVDPEINTNNSCGIQGIHLISQVEAKRIQLAFNPPPVQLSVIERGRKNKKKADVIEDIYKLFSDIRTPLRDCSPSLLIEQPDCD